MYVEFVFGQETKKALCTDQTSVHKLKVDDQLGESLNAAKNEQGATAKNPVIRGVLPIKIGDKERLLHPSVSHEYWFLDTTESHEHSSEQKVFLKMFLPVGHEPEGARLFSVRLFDE